MNEASPPMEGTPLISPSSTEHPLYNSIVDACRTVFDPEIPVNIYDLGLIYTIEINEDNENLVDDSCLVPVDENDKVETDDEETYYRRTDRRNPCRTTR